MYIGAFLHMLVLLNTFCCTILKGGRRFHTVHKLQFLLPRRIGSHRTGLLGGNLP